MMPERKPKDATTGGMTSRQKMIAVVLVIILLVIVWQIMGLFGGGGGSSSPSIAEITPAQKAAGAMTANTPGSAGTPGTSGAAPPSQPIVPQVAPENVTFREVPVAMEPQLVDLQKKTEQKFLEQVNQLQMLKIQREIAETNQAIASARLATVTAEKNVSDLLTKPTQPPAQATPPPGAPIPPAPGNVPPAEVAEAPPPPPPPVVIVPYNVISVSWQLGKWNAVLSFQGKLFNVSVGDILPLDGSVVREINRNGVVLTKEGKRRRISIVSTL